ncbi:MAG: MOSC domain-containing protein [Candidatus Cloacimonetes bacterium]|jgi:MOSC domain-containing protein YiiM|nr:MOSC domain-containing protein [Candidatus Cloacimonadota bacterium]MBT6994383.1 MOSC domain-containing protein [Candidatus Cloacimonadota bacterium]MBT7468986.1 MOSC domain-containing protein [Candidatus Cloacimonadota bacterium]
MKKEFKILSINISLKKGEQKKPTQKVFLKKDFGIVGDAHAGNWHRQISMLANEDIETMRGKGIELKFGDFAENITTENIDLCTLPLRTKLHLGNAVVEVTQIGKECHHGCEIFQKIGDCVMPRKGIFVIVLEEGEISNESNCYYHI